jgi:DNA repair exonuclease SbcCD ATPase subunit
MEIEEEQRRMQEKQEQERQITAARAQQEALAAQNAELQKRLAAFLAAKAADDGTAGAEEVAGDGAGEVENRYFHALRQAADLGAELVQVQLNYDHVALDMKTRLEQKQDRVRELREGYAAARSEAVKGGAGGQRIVPGKLLKQFEEQGARKEQELERVRLKNIHLRNQLRKLEGNLRRKEELSNELHLIDFEQLKIENQTLNEKIEERNEELLKLRKKTTTTVQVLTHLKEKLQFVQGENQLLKVELAELEAALSQHRDALTRVKHERDALRSDNLALRGEAGLIGNNDLLRDFDRRKKDIASMQVTLEDLKNRHLSVREDITELNARTMGVLTLGASR